MARVVTLHPGAEADVQSVIAFIARRVSPAAAARWHARVTAVMGRLSADAGQWPEADEGADLGLDLRCRLFGRRHKVYRILFTYDDQTVTVLRVRHAAQDRLTADDF
jgi:plasmid stabilization system protein ParE